MEEDSNDSQSCIFIRESNIRAIESNIQALLDGFEKEDSDTTFLETSNVCDNVRDQILFYEDEPHLSKTQNNCRRIFIASDLFISICSIYGHIVDNEFTKIINDMLQWEKYKKLSHKIMHQMHLETKKEKFFAKEAESKLLKSLEDAESRILGEKQTETEERESAQRPFEDSELIQGTREGVETPMEVMEQILMSMEGRETGAAVSSQRESPVGLKTNETCREAAPAYDINENLDPPLENTFRDDILSNVSGTLTEMRAESVTDTSRLQYPMSNISRQDLSLLDTLAETSIEQPVVQDKTDDDLNRILQILEDQNFQKDIGDVPQPIEPTEGIPDVPKDTTVEEIQTEGEIRAEESKRSEEWSLPSLEPVGKTRKRARLIIDEVTVIPEYASRALHLNRNINIERVQVFEGPPNILQGISVNHLMKTPGYKSSLFQDIRSSRLSALYSRHLISERKPVEPVLPRRVVEKRRDDASKVTVEVEERIGMRPVREKGDALAELPPDKSRLEDLEIPTVAAPPKESLIGMPVSRIISSAIEPPEEVQMELINAAPILPTPRVQQLQGKSLDPKTTTSWFLSSKQNPPNGKYREFNYVYKKLLQYWTLFEIQGMEKCITLREFFSFEEDNSLANYLTAMRIVDKLSIQRKLILEFKNNDVFIRPFESPYVSDGQLLLKGRKPLF